MSAPSPSYDASAAEPLSAPAQDARIDPALLKLGAAIALGVFMSLLDTTIVNVAIGALSSHFHTTISQVQWVTTGYLLALGLFLPLTGWATDRFGSRRLFIGSIVVFTLASLACGLAPGIGALIVFRIVQGAGGAFIMPVAQAVIAREAGPQRIGRLMSLIGIPALLAPILGPVIGGLLIDSLSWRWVFFVNVPIGVVAVAWCARVLPPDRAQPGKRLDRLGLALICPGFAALVYGLSSAGTAHGFASVGVLGWLIGGVAAVGGFVFHALRLGERALIPIAYLRDRAFAAGSVSTFISGATLYGAMILIPLYYQEVRGETALSAGLLLIPQGVGSAAAMALSGVITDRSGPRRMVAAGMGVMLAGTVVFTQLGTNTSNWILLLALFVRGIGLGMSMMPAMAGSYRNLDPSLVGQATTTLNIFQRIGGSIATALVTVVLADQISSHASGSLASRLTAQAAAYGTAFWIVTAITAVGLVASYYLPSGSPPAAVPASQPQSR